MPDPMRFVNQTKEGRVLIRSDGKLPALLYSTDYHVTVRNEADGPRIELMFSRRYRALSVLFEALEGQQTAGENPAYGGLGETFLRAEALVELSPTLAAQLVVTLLNSLSQSAPDALIRAGLIVEQQAPPTEHNEAATTDASADEPDKGN